MPDDIRFNIPVHSLLRAEEIAGRTFPRVRRGFDPAKVQAFLDSVARDLKLLIEREEELRAQLSDAEHRAANPVIDEGTLTAALGQEAASLLKSARSTAAEVLAEAQAHAAEALNDARQAADAMRADAEDVLAEAGETARTTVDEASKAAAEDARGVVDAARLEAENLVGAAKDECRTMLKEAQELRSKVLNDMARRRRTLQIQLEQLRAGRDSLLGSVREVRRAIDQIAEDLHKAEGEARGAAEAAGEQAAGEPDEAPGEQLAEHVADLGEGEARGAAEAAGEQAAGEPDEAPGEQLAEDVADLGEGEARGAAEAAGEQAAGEPDEAPGEQLAEHVADLGEGEHRELVEVAEAVPVTHAELAGRVEGVTAHEQVQEPAVAGEVIDDLFARIRATASLGDEPAAAERVANDPASEPPRSVAANPAAGEAASTGSRDEIPAAVDRSRLVKRRDEIIVPIVAGLARKLKRALQDEQNVMLDLLRQRGKRQDDETSLVDAIAAVLGQGDRYRRASEIFFEQARRAAAEHLDATGAAKYTASHRPPSWLHKHAHDLAVAIVGPLKAKLIEDVEMDPTDEANVAERIGAAYRDWKGQRIEFLAADAVIGVFSRASVAAAPPGTRFAWILDEVGSPCPDCEDNSLSGPIELDKPGESGGSADSGGAYPTGHLHPPAHPGCRCLLVPENLLVHEGSDVLR
ncbi:MAG: DivIVA domain-containing protein [Acidimicrobiales bacterium]